MTRGCTPTADPCHRRRVARSFWLPAVWCCAVLGWVGAPAAAQTVTKRVLYVTQSAGFPHPVLALSRTILQQIGTTSGLFTTTLTDDVSLIDANFLEDFDAVVFFTSGELPMNDGQKQALLQYVEHGGGFVGVHSATDTFYTWPEYGELIGGYFDGHPWTESVTISVEDAGHPATASLAPSFTIDDEIYQFRDWSRADVHVLMSLDTSSVDLTVAGVNRQDGDFALAWTRLHGAGRVFYTALGHRPEVWQDARFQNHLLEGIRWAMADADQDGLQDWWETRFGLDPALATGVHGGNGDPDGDGRTNAAELDEDTHPRGFRTRYLAEGASTSFLDTRLSIANPTVGSTARVLLGFLTQAGERITHALSVPPLQSRKVLVDGLPGMAGKEFATVIESDAEVVVDRMMWWGAPEAYGTHAETSVAGPATTWYLAEGSTHGNFELFYLLQNPGASASTVHVRYLLPQGGPLERNYEVDPGSRLTLWVDTVPGLAATDVSAVLTVTSGPPIIVERAMYLNRPGQTFAAGHESAGVTAPALDWFTAEGATGDFFDMFLLLANPGTEEALVEATYLLPDGSTLDKTYPVPAASRFNIWVDAELIPGHGLALADTAVSVALHVTNGVPIIVERAMWWPAPAPSWHEAHNASGAVASASRWVLADGDVGGPPGNTETYILIANTSPFVTDVKVTLLYADGSAAESRTFTVNPTSRFNVDVGAHFPAAVGRGFGAIVESTGVPAASLVVEQAIYNDAGGVRWAAGTAAAATPVP